MIPCDDVVSKFLNCIFMLRDRRGFGDLLSWRISFFRVVPFSCHCLTLHSSSYTQTQIVCRSFNFSLDSSYQLQDSGGRTVRSKPSTEHNAVRHTQALSHHTRARRLRGHQDRWSIEWVSSLLCDYWNRFLIFCVCRSSKRRFLGNEICQFLPLL